MAPAGAPPAGAPPQSLPGQLWLTAGTDGSSQQSQPCGPDEYNADALCCKLCAAGQQVREHRTSPHTEADCVVCANGTFTVHPNGDTSCFPCSSCAKDRKMAEECTPTSDTRCQCPHGSFQQQELGLCRPCTDCAGGRVLQECSATRDAVCGGGSPLPSGNSLAVIISFAVIIPLIVIVPTVIACRGRGSAGASRNLAVSRGTFLRAAGAACLARLSCLRTQNRAHLPTRGVEGADAEQGLSLSS